MTRKMSRVKKTPLTDIKQKEMTLDPISVLGLNFNPRTTSKYSSGKKNFVRLDVEPKFSGYDIK